ncbi:MEKHLA domain-containing protein [Myxosarcina sp. GI1]|uniref:MEKHLA domain-containing protein n=1 Tax=Myxosarcina sp. GI1 TaxID=1541065 RepID=UPI0005620389|nr:MEKHLA domain-containing protein [Myxosarcina sp. GI1]
MSLPIWQQPATIVRSQILVNSFRRTVGKELISATNNPEILAKNLFFAPFVLVSHGTQKDPVLNYGNKLALKLWEMPWETFTQTPSRLTAERENRETRKMMLERVTQQGYIDDYKGIRISSKGTRFLIKKAIVWNLQDKTGELCGQAATFSKWSVLEA